MRRVIVESPWAADTEAQAALHKRYLNACLRDCLINHNEAPYASHAIYTRDGVLRDGVPEERAIGIHAGLAWGDMAERTVVYQDHGVTEGMTKGIIKAKRQGRPVEYRSLGPGWEKGG